MGAVLSDNVKNQKTAVLCFVKAIEVDPKLMPPRQGVWFAGYKRMLEFMVDHDFHSIIGNATEVEKVGEIDYANDKFFSYKGLALEILEKNKEAQIAYLVASSLNPSCYISNEGLKRLETNNKVNGPMVRVYRLIEDNAFSRYSEESRYQWA